MDEKRFKRIETKEEVLILLGQGEHLFDHNMTEFYYDKDNEAVMRHDYCGKPQMTSMPINTFLEYGFYIKKPFDVREAMRERPNEWVAAFKNDDGRWLKVGFNEHHMKVLMASKEYCFSVERAGVQDVDYVPTPKDLDKCIPINEVPKEES